MTPAEYLRETARILRTRLARGEVLVMLAREPDRYAVLRVLPNVTSLEIRKTNRDLADGYIPALGEGFGRTDVQDKYVSTRCETDAGA